RRRPRDAGGLSPHASRARWAPGPRARALHAALRRGHGAQGGGLALRVLSRDGQAPAGARARAVRAGGAEGRDLAALARAGGAMGAMKRELEALGAVVRHGSDAAADPTTLQRARRRLFARAPAPRRARWPAVAMATAALV